MIDNYTDFWDYYVREHSRPATRALHFVGTSLGVILLAWFILRGTWYYFPLCFVVGYAFAWIAHFAIEKNKPATFKYPLWSFVSDYKMMWYMITGRMSREIERIFAADKRR
ncbi:MAG: Mpo1-like protein [Pyrinomonadaceae bacterium]